MTEKKISRKKLRVVGKQVNKKYDIICGPDNPATLGATYYILENGEIAVPFVAHDVHTGHDKIMHGGLSAAVLDEGMGRAAAVYSRRGDDSYDSQVTGTFTTKYYHPIPTEKYMCGYCRVDSVEGRKSFTSSEILDEEGNVMIESTGIYISVPQMLDKDDAPVAKDIELCDDDPKYL